MRKLFGVWMSLVITASAFGQTGGTSPTTFRLMDTMGMGTFITLPRKLRFRCVYYQPVFLSNTSIGEAEPPNDRAGKVTRNGAAVIGDAAMARMPVFRGEMHGGQTPQVTLSGTYSQYMIHDNGNPAVMGGAVNLTWTGGQVLSNMSGPNRRSSPSHLLDQYKSHWFCYRFAGMQNGLFPVHPDGWCTGFPGYSVDLAVGHRFSEHAGPLGAGTVVRIWCDSRVRYVGLSCSYGATDAYNLRGPAGEEWLWAEYVLEADPGTAESGTPEDWDEIVQGLVEVRNAITALREDLQDWRVAWNTQDMRFLEWYQKWQLQDTRLATHETSLIALLTSIAAPSEATVDPQETTPPDVFDAPSGEVWANNVGDTVEALHGISGMVESRDAGGNAPNWSWTVPMGTWSAGIGGPPLPSITLAADFSPLVPWRIYIHAFFYACLGMWSVSYLWEEFRKY